MIKILHLERYMPCVCVGVSGWVHAGAYEHGCWHQLCSSIHFYFIFLHLGVSLNQMNRIDRKPRDPLVSDSPVLGL